LSLQIIARLKATAHLWHRFNLYRSGHDIWRVYRWWGWDTTRVICTCGKEFTRRPAGAPSVQDILVAVRKRGGSTCQKRQPR
jgi:hypothetical protein